MATIKNLASAILDMADQEALTLSGLESLLARELEVPHDRKDEPIEVKAFGLPDGVIYLDGVAKLTPEEWLILRDKGSTR